MGQLDVYTDLCKKCFIRLHKMSKRDIEKIVLTDEKQKCDKCGRTDFIVDYVED